MAPDVSAPCTLDGPAPNILHSCGSDLFWILVLSSKHSRSIRWLLMSGCKSCEAPATDVGFLMGLCFKRRSQAIVTIDLMIISFYMRSAAVCDPSLLELCCCGAQHDLVQHGFDIDVHGSYPENGSAFISRPKALGTEDHYSCSLKS